MVVAGSLVERQGENLDHLPPQDLGGATGGKRQGVHLVHHRREKRRQSAARVDRAGTEPVRIADLLGQGSLADLQDAEFIAGVIGEAIGLVAAFDNETARIAADLAAHLLELDRASPRDGDQIFFLAGVRDMRGPAFVLQWLGREARERDAPHLPALQCP